MRPSLLLTACALADISTTWAQHVSEALLEVPWQKYNAKVNDLVVALTPEEKISLVHHTLWPQSQNFAGYIKPVQRLGIPALQMADGEAYETH
jgi:beta-glucosidase